MIKKIYSLVFVLLLSFSAVVAQDGEEPGNRPLRVIGLTSDQRLIRFGENNPREAVTLAQISGFSGGNTALVGIDYRVQDGLLYGVGNAGAVYTVNVDTGVLTFVNSLTVALSGTRFGVDFNPAADRLRIISDTGQNLRHNVNPGGVTINDPALNYTGTTATGVTGAAYTNDDLDPNTDTLLYDIDSTLNQLVVQSPANSGQLASIGRLGVNTTSNVGFDIYSTIRGGTTVNVEGFATLQPENNPLVGFYSIALFSGRPTFRGAFSLQNQVIDIAVPLNQRRRRGGDD